MNVLITGASGLIGLNLCREILEKKIGKIFVNYRNEIEKPFLSVLNPQRVTPVVGDINDLLFLNQLPKFDVIFHLSGYGQPKKFLENPDATFSMNSFSTDVLLNKKLNKNGKFIFMSSSEVYANGTFPSEDSKILLDLENARNPYILGKLAGESLVNVARQKGVDAKSIRICLAYGPGFKKNDNRVINELIMRGCDTGEVSLMDDGSARRKYIYINDSVNMIMNITFNGKQNLYNVGGKEELSILDLAKEIALQTNSKVSIKKKKNAAIGSPAFAGVLISRYEKEFGEVSLTSIKEGVRNSIKWYQNYNAA